jgi:hypothetical protein
LPTINYREESVDMCCVGEGLLGPVPSVCRLLWPGGSQPGIRY